VVPGIEDRPRGCLFHPRCRFAEQRCVDEQPLLVPDARGRFVRCHYALVDGEPTNKEPGSIRGEPQRETTP
jgi:dipeptide transport system ATP-binding protein